MALLVPTIGVLAGVPAVPVAGRAVAPGDVPTTVDPVVRDGETTFAADMLVGPTPTVAMRSAGGPGTAAVAVSFAVFTASSGLVHPTSVTLSTHTAIPRHTCHNHWSCRISPPLQV